MDYFHWKLFYHMQETILGSDNTVESHLQWVAFMFVGVLQMDAINAVTRNSKITQTQDAGATLNASAPFLEHISEMISADSCDPTKNFIYDLVYDTAKQVGVIEEEKDGTIRIGEQIFANKNKHSLTFMSAIDTAMRGYYASKLRFSGLTAYLTAASNFTSRLSRN